MEITLVEKDGDLYYPGEDGAILIYRYPEGDCDAISWPNPDMKNLRGVLFDDRECGRFEDEDIIKLPDGTVVEF